jgi:hypothetical protein
MRDSYAHGLLDQATLMAAAPWDIGCRFNVRLVARCGMYVFVCLYLIVADLYCAYSAQYAQLQAATLSLNKKQTRDFLQAAEASLLLLQLPTCKPCTL